MPKSTTETNSTAATFIDLENIPSMESLLGGQEQQETTPFAPGKIVTGRVASKTDAGVLVDIGYKSEGMIPREEFRDFSTIEEGQQVDVFIEVLEDEEADMPLLSARKAELQKAWGDIVENYEEGSIIRGTVRRRVKGGLIVDVGVDAFLPGSQVDVGPVRNLDDYVGVDEDFKILKISPERRNIVVSRRELVEAERAEQRAQLLDELEVGQLRKGVVKNITDFGAFVDLDAMDGLLHITDMSWGRISHPGEMLSVGDEIEVMILDIDNEKQRVSLGLKQKEGNPWEDVDQKYPEGSRIHGRVVNVLPYGAFVELEQGVEGLVHVSEMSWIKRITKASDVLQVGDEVDAIVLDVQKDARKISLGLRQTTENPWEILAEQMPSGTKIKGQVRNMTSYGAFVKIQDDIDGMIHVSDMSWTRKINHPSEILEKGQEVEAVILDIDPEQQRISLGLKQLIEDPWANIDEHFQVGDTVNGTVTKITSFGAFVRLQNDVEGLLHISQLSDEHIERVEDVVQEGQELEAQVVKIDPDERRIGLSLKEGGGESTHEASGAEVRRRLERGEEMVDMGDLFQDAIAVDDSGRAEDETEEETGDDGQQAESADEEAESADEKDESADEKDESADEKESGK
ncbi:MAG: 30S ribosomal protein S1 [Lentisphaeria bacterium]